MISENVMSTHLPGTLEKKMGDILLTLSDRKILKTSKSMQVAAEVIIEGVEIFLSSISTEDKLLFQKAFTYPLHQLSNRLKHFPEIIIGSNFKTILDSQRDVQPKNCGKFNKLSVNEVEKLLNTYPFSSYGIKWQKGIEWHSYMYLNMYPCDELRNFFEIFQIEILMYKNIYSETSKSIDEIRARNACLQKYFSGLPDETLYFMKACKLVESRLNNKMLIELLPEGILNLISEIYSCFHEKKGEYRTFNHFVFFENKAAPNIPFEKIETYVLSRATLEEKKIWNESTREKVEKEIYGDAASCQIFKHRFTADDLTVLKYIGFTFPVFETIPTQMNKYVGTLMEKLRNETDPFVIMEWCFRDLLRIHPFPKGNEIICRIFINIIGLQAGLNPIFFDKEKYFNALESDKRISFLEYLKSQEKNPIKLNPGVNAILKKIIDATLEFEL